MTIPAHVRDQLGLRAGDEVEFVLDGAAARLVPVAKAPGLSQRDVDRLAGSGDIALTTDELMALTRDGWGAEPETPGPRHVSDGAAPGSREAVERTAGILPGVYAEDYLLNLRAEWPD
ncbi:AbrB/MazE/SpoVT family DNA-binding domain-containing protein [Spiractinospora alimapuensis]|nr:AbrB/MazE/SpoVT family DNA-binding domain-containing protein [Spiractinospora alimapuensis]